jgi:hypothetical protein
MASFWTPNRNLKTGNGNIDASFIDGKFETDDPETINMLRGKIKLHVLEIVETTPPPKSEVVETTPPPKSKAMKEK